jgi:hypothetical protein
MTYESFEDLPVWQKAADLYEATEELSENEAFQSYAWFSRSVGLRGPIRLQ